jgi:hypothetical protein
VRVSPVRKRMMVCMKKIVRTERLDEMKEIRSRCFLSSPGNGYHLVVGLEF